MYSKTRLGFSKPFQFEIQHWRPTHWSTFASLDLVSASRGRTGWNVVLWCRTKADIDRATKTAAAPQNISWKGFFLSLSTTSLKEIKCKAAFSDLSLSSASRLFCSADTWVSLHPKRARPLWSWTCGRRSTSTAATSTSWLRSWLTSANRRPWFS